MRSWTKVSMCAGVVLLCCGVAWPEDLLQVRDLFNGKDLSGWVNVNTAPDTWSVKDGMIVCTRKTHGGPAHRPAV